MIKSNHIQISNQQSINIENSRNIDCDKINLVSIAFSKVTFVFYNQQRLTEINGFDTFYHA